MKTAARSSRVCWQTLRNCIVLALAVYYVTTCCVLLGFWFGWPHVRTPSTAFHRPADVDFIDALTHWDGRWYLRIVEEGYQWTPGAMSSVAFFPAYPLLGKVVAAAGIDPRIALLLTAHGTFLAALATVIYYESVAREKGDEVAGALWPAVVLAAWPFSLFYRAAYSEGLFLLIETLVLVGMRRQWRPAALAVWIGALTACRSVGVAMVVAFAVYLWGRRPDQRRGRFLLVSGLLLLGSCWEIAAYAAYSWLRFENPLTFVETQAAWRNREPLPGFWDQAAALATLKPARDVYDPTCKCFWHLDPPHGDPAFNMSFWNPVVLLGTAATVAWGWRRRTISLPEFTFAAMAPAIPYLLQSYTHCFMSGARFATIILPFFVVVGRGVGILPGPAAALMVGVEMVFLFAFAAGFAADFWVF